jgi:hypothetical protein
MNNDLNLHNNKKMKKKSRNKKLLSVTEIRRKNTMRQSQNETLENDNEYVLDEKTEINVSFKKTYKLLLSTIRIIYKAFQLMLSISGIYLIWICLHYFASHLYVRLCVPTNFYGFLLSPFLIATPYCVGLRWLIYTGANVINNMWVLLGTWICSNISIFNHSSV